MSSPLPTVLLVNARMGSKAGSAQRNSSLITKLFLSLQSRPDADMEEFFRYENHREPSRLSNQGSLRSGNKSDILEWLKAPTGRSAEAKAATVVVLDMTAVVHMVRPTSAHIWCHLWSHKSLQLSHGLMLSGLLTQKTTLKP